MNELSLFSGAGGGLLGTKLLGFTPIGYVELDDYCQRVLAARIKDGILPDAPIFGDIKTFIDSGCAELCRGVTDVITAGFPCQPFSVAGKQKGADDERNMWPATATVIGIVKPRFVLLENVPGIRTYLPVVVRDLRRLGYEVSRPLILGADDVGAPHRRKRVWIVAKSNAVGCGWGPDNKRCAAAGRNGDTLPVGQDSIGGGFDQGCSSVPRQESRGTFVSDADCHAANPYAAGSQKREVQPGNVRQERQAAFREPWNENWLEAATRLCRVANGVAHRVDRLKALGNGQVPRVVATAWRILTKLNGGNDGDG